jgi:hypothetical protein
MARFVWNMLYIIFNIQQPKSTSHMFGSWLRSFAPRIRCQIIVGMTAMCWAIWLNRNDVVFQREVTNSFLQVIFRGTFWIRQWLLLSKEEEGRLMKEGCKHLEGVALQLFGSRNWKNQKRLEV